MKKTGAFTVIELILVMAIITLLGTLLSPALGRAKARAESVGCAANLKKIFVAVSGAATDNDDRYPYIEPRPKTEKLYPELEAKGLLETLEPYGITERDLKCSADLKKGANSFFAIEGTSYEWSPYVNDETTIAPKFYGRRNVYTRKLSRTRLVRDFENVHFNRPNWLYADGHVSIPPVQ